MDLIGTYILQTANTVENSPLVNEKYGNPTENDLEKAKAFAETSGGIHNTHKGPIFYDNFKEEVDDKIAGNYYLFNSLASYVDEKGDENSIMGCISISEIKNQWLRSSFSSDRPITVKINDKMLDK